jgi:uncharacterized membrane protein YhaH (DUF805 family)
MGLRGRILNAAGAGQPGRVEADDGETYSFEASQVRAGTLLKAGAEADFILLRGQVRDLFIVPPEEARNAPPPAETAPPKTYYRPIKAETVLTYYRRAMTTRHMLDVKGRARRKEYFSIALCSAVAIQLANAADWALAHTINPGYLLFGWLPQMSENGREEPVILFAVTLIVSLVHLMALVPATIRRLHDAGREASALLIVFLPYIGIFFLLAQTFQDSQAEENKYGPSPKYRS